MPIRSTNSNRVSNSLSSTVPGLQPCYGVVAHLRNFVCDAEFWFAAAADTVVFNAEGVVDEVVLDGGAGGELDS